MEFFLMTSEFDERPIYITGNFNGWNPKEAKYQMKELDEGEYYIKIDDEILPKKIEYKFTKGGWEHVELDQYGNITFNRVALLSQKKAEDRAEKWRYNWGPFKNEFFPIVELIDKEFYIPQLDKTRKVWALLPHNYYKSQKRYPVLYLQDAQNLFNGGSKYGNWEIDKKLSVLAEYHRGDIVVIAVEHGDDDRIQEFVFQNPKLTKNAEGKRYIRFVTDTLKPFVDAKYRTLKDRENTGIGGSSLGALISIYGGFLYPEVYSKLMLFSPSLWVEPKNNFPVIGFQYQFETKVYLYGGKKEGAQLIRRIKGFERSMKRWEKQGLFSFELRESINEEGMHQEFYWSQEFPKAIEWLYFDQKKIQTTVVNSTKLKLKKSD
jgi:predicted alpha/beta superfamily hydrolase